MFNRDEFDESHIPHIVKCVEIYQAKDGYHSRRKIQYQVQVFPRRLHDRKQGPRAIRNAVSAMTTRPLTALTRDRPGPRDEPTGTVATDPAEVDDIAQ